MDTVTASVPGLVDVSFVFTTKARKARARKTVFAGKNNSVTRRLGRTYLQQSRSQHICVGNYSYPGGLIAKRRSLEWEGPRAGRPCRGLDGIPPCSYSINAFGLDEMFAAADPPEWFNEGTLTKQWILPAATVSIWPYEEMYGEDVRLAGVVPGLPNVRRPQPKVFSVLLAPMLRSTYREDGLRFENSLQAT